MPKRRRRRALYVPRKRRKVQQPGPSRDHALQVVSPVLLLFLTVRELAFMAMVGKWWSVACKRPGLLDCKRIGIPVWAKKHKRLLPYHILPLVTKLTIGVRQFSKWQDTVGQMVNLRHVAFGGTIPDGTNLFGVWLFYTEFKKSVRILSYKRPEWVLLLRSVNSNWFKGLRGLDTPVSHRLTVQLPSLTALRTNLCNSCPVAKAAPNIQFIHFSDSYSDKVLGRWRESFLSPDFTSSQLLNVEAIIIDHASELHLTPGVRSSLRHLRVGVFHFPCMLGFFQANRRTGLRVYSSLETLEVLVRNWFFFSSNERRIGDLLTYFSSDGYPRLTTLRIAVCVRWPEFILPCDYELREGVMVRWSYVDPVIRRKEWGVGLDLAFKDSPFGTAQQAFDRYCDQ